MQYRTNKEIHKLNWVLNKTLLKICWDGICGISLYLPCKTSTYTGCLQLFKTINSIPGFVETLSSNAIHSKLSKEHYVMDILVYAVNVFLFMKYKSDSTNTFSIYEFLGVSPCKYLLGLRDFNGSPRNQISEFFISKLNFSDNFVQNFRFPAGP